MPADYVAPPELSGALDFYLEAFWELGSCRSVTEHGWEGAIPWTAIDAYARRMDLEGDRFARLKTIIRAVDGEYLKVKSGQITEARERQKELDAEAQANAAEVNANKVRAAMAKKLAVQNKPKPKPKG